MATIGALVFEMSANVARLQQDMAKARSTVEGAMAGISSAANMAKAALGAIGVGASIAGFEQMIMGAIEGEAALHKLNLQTGISVELLSALRPVAKQSGTDIDTVAGMVNKLEKNMTSFAQTGGGKAADAFKQLGYSQADVQKGLKNMDTFLPEFAKRLMETGVGGEQAGLAMQLMAKGGAAALPFLKQLVETGELHAKVTTDQAEAAHQFEVNLVKLQGASNALKLQIANALLPTLNDITQAMLDARKAGDGFFGSMVEGAKAAMQAMMGWNTAGDLAKVNQQIVELTDKWMGLEKIQGTRGVSAERVAGVKAELDALIAKRNQLEQIAKIEAPGKKDAQANKALDPIVKEKKVHDDRQKLLDQDTKNLLEAVDTQTKEYEEYLRTIGKMDDDRARELKKQLDDDTAEYIRSLQVQMDEADRVQTAIAEQMTKVTKATKDENTWARELGLTFTSAFENSIAKGQGLRSVLQGLGQDIIKIMARNLITEPLGKAVSDRIGGTSGVSGYLKNIFGGDSEPVALNTYAVGTDYVPFDQVAQIHKGEKIIPANQNGGGGGVNITFSVVAMDSRSFGQSMVQNRALIVGIINDAMRKSGVSGGFAV